MERTPEADAGPSDGEPFRLTWGVILRMAARFGYQIPDLAWLKLRELDTLACPEEEDVPEESSQAHEEFSF
jgi:hypothetical protein